MELDSKLEKLIKQQAKYKSANLGLNLLIARLQRKYSANQTPEELNSCIQEMNAFFQKYPSIMKMELEILKNL